VGPSFLKEPPSRVDFANETGARIDCSAEGSPPPNISWLSGDGKPVGPIPQTRELLANGSLLFPPFRPSGYRHDVHAATYRCVADNSVGRVHSRDVRVRAGKRGDVTLTNRDKSFTVEQLQMVVACAFPSFRTQVSFAVIRLLIRLVLVCVGLVGCNVV
jgi:hypothetical protein